MPLGNRADVIMEFKGRIKDISRNLLNNRFIISIETEQDISSVEELRDKDLRCDIKKYRNRRSLDANAYFWVLLDKLATVLKIPKDELYRGYVRNIGGNSETICVQNKAVDRLIDGWQHNGTGWVTDTFESKIEDCTNVVLYYGSSTYDTEQMSRLIDSVVQDCKAVGIETMTPQELDNLMRVWEESKA